MQNFNHSNNNGDNKQPDPQKNPQTNQQPDPQKNPQANQQTGSQQNYQSNPQANQQQNYQQNTQANPQQGYQQNPQPNYQANQQAGPQNNYQNQQQNYQQNQQQNYQQNQQNYQPNYQQNAQQTQSNNGGFFANIINWGVNLAIKYGRTFEIVIWVLTIVGILFFPILSIVMTYFAYCYSRIKPTRGYVMIAVALIGSIARIILGMNQAEDTDDGVIWYYWTE